MEKNREQDELEKSTGASAEQVMEALHGLVRRAGESFDALSREAQPVMKELFARATPEAQVDPEHEAYGAAVTAWLAIGIALTRRLSPGMRLGTALAAHALAERVRFPSDGPEVNQRPASA